MILVNVCVASLILLLGALPHIFMTVFNASSLAVGLLLYVLLMQLFFLRYIKSLERMPVLLLAFLAVIFIYMLFQAALIGGMNFKSFASMPLFLIICIASMLTAVKIYHNRRLNLLKVLHVLVVFLIIIGLLSCFNVISISSYTHPYAVVPFTEPSHYALFSGAFFMMFFVVLKYAYQRALLVLLLVFYAVSLPTATMFVYVFLMLMLIMRFNVPSMIVVLVGVLISVSVIVLSPYFMDRFMVFGDTNNLSVLVYKQGFQDMYNSLLQTNYLGLGFQMLGTQPPSEVAGLISEIVGFEAGLNREDGSFLFAKIVAEFGVLGIVLSLIYFYTFIKSFVFLRRAIKQGLHGSDIKIVLVYSVVYSFIVEFLFRGYGYFSPGVFMLLLAQYYLAKYSNMNGIKRKYSGLKLIGESHGGH